jgi:hypothetical protein
MPWRPEDWSEWPVERWVATYRDDAALRAVREILLRLPDRERQTVLELTRGPSAWTTFLKTRFAQRVEVDLTATSAPELPGRCEVVLAVDTIGVAHLEPLLPRVHAALVEGGVLLATLAATPPGTTRLSMIGPVSGPGIHEVELQYRLRRAGFQGLRLRRFRSDDDTLLCMAVRRACN